jgi:hypothetical protein
MATAVAGRAVRTRVKARLVLEINGTEFLLRTFEDLSYRHMMD